MEAEPMRASMMRFVVLLGCYAGGVLVAHADDDERLMGHSRADVEATFPNLPADARPAGVPHSHHAADAGEE